MSRVSKNYFTLDELVGIWKLIEPDLRYVVENGLLTLSVRIVGKRMEIGGYEEMLEGGRFYIPYERRQMDGLVDLCRQDTFTLFRDGSVSPRGFCLPGDEVAELVRDEDVICLHRSDLLVRRDERDQFEKNVLHFEERKAGKHIDFRCFEFKSEVYEFTEMQSRALQFLFDSARNGDPERHYREILDAASSASSKLGHLFSSRPKWVRILRKVIGRRGWYYMEPKLVVTLMI